MTGDAKDRVNGSLDVRNWRRLATNLDHITVFEKKKSVMLPVKKPRGKGWHRTTM
jgi:hypothetical protein